MKRFWRWLFPESPADALKREANAVFCQEQAVAWMLRQDFYEKATRSEAAMGSLRLIVERNDFALFRKGSPGAKWAATQGFKVDTEFTFLGPMRILRWS